MIVATVAGIGTRSNFSRAIIASSVIILIPSISYFYVLVFMLIPFMEFVRSYESFGKAEAKAYFAMFMFLFCVLALLPQSYIVHTVIVFAMLVMECRRAFKNDIIPFFKNRKTLKEA